MSERGKKSPFWLSLHQGPIQECWSLVSTKTCSREPRPHSTRDKPGNIFKGDEKRLKTVFFFFQVPRYSRWECCTELSCWSRQNTVLFWPKYVLFKDIMTGYQVFQLWKCLPLRRSCPSTPRSCGRWSAGRRWSTCGRSPRNVCTWTRLSIRVDI